MADCEAPSFSLGFEFGFESEPQAAVEEHSVLPKPAPDTPGIDSSDRTPIDGDGDEKFGHDVADLDPETGPEPPRVLKRLRRGPPQLREMPPASSCNGEEEIEEFSSQEDIFQELHPSAQPSAQYYAMCSSSKFPLNGCGAIRKSSSNWNARKDNPVSTATASASMETCHKDKFFPRSTVSPLRMFQLIDSDSDDPSTIEEGTARGNHEISETSKKQRSNVCYSATTSEEVRKASDYMPPGEDLWKDFCPIKSVHIPTPALDQLCEEYFHSVNDKKASEKLGSNLCVKRSSGFVESTNGQSVKQSLNVSNPLPPAHHYFLHHDPRIWKLVRNRLPEFFPLGIVDDSGNQQIGASFIDYMGQFGNRGPTKQQATQQVDLGRSAKRGRSIASEEVFLGSRSLIDRQQGKATRGSTAKKASNKRNNKSVKLNTGEVFHASENWVDPKQGTAARKSSVKRSSKKGRNTGQTSSAGEGLHGSGSWVDPRRSAGIGQDSGKRGAHSNGQSVGHWFTGPDGRKVYVNQNGQELTGQIAYRQYKKDKGAGTNKVKRKTSSKKKKS
ncbi:Rho GTPase-activating protein [Parasponia andersonii]|uniref:Rho GTPase-activating protein n=1 Tax=Parasponia andersonii TaxID=3476 RepID=A0A2P5BRS6_PARAD|nr:Rho GTPase-activating protein [Parasponia andersonii]